MNLELKKIPTVMIYQDNVNARKMSKEEHAVLAHPYTMVSLIVKVGNPCNTLKILPYRFLAIENLERKSRQIK